MKQSLISLLIITFVLRAGAAGTLPDEVKDVTYQYEVVRHLYRWYLDESDLEKLPASNTLAVWLRDATPEKLDEGDQSRWVEMGIPAFRVRVTLKKTNYRIKELDATVLSRTFKIVDVLREPDKSETPKDATVRQLVVADMRDYLFRTRMNRDPLDSALADRLRHAISQQITADKQATKSPEQVVYIGPMSPVANELWIFWETGRKLIRIASDIELANPAVWDHEKLAVRVFDIETHTVVSLSEVPGSNAFLTRDQVGRILYNCMVFGERRTSPTPRGQPDQRP